MKNNKTGSKIKELITFDKHVFFKLSLLVVFTAVLNISIVWGQLFPTETIVGTFLLIGLLLLILYKDSVRYRPELKNDYKLILLVGTLLSGNFVIGRSLYYVMEGFTKWLGTVDLPF